ncbi:MAG: c-type cytochrome biogenesis protein CcsB [Desulfobacterales bacterium]
MNSSLFLSLTTFIYGLAAVLYIVAWVFRNRKFENTAIWIMIAGATGNLAGFVLRWIETYRLGIGHVPLSNLYESLVFFALTISVLYFWMDRRYQNRAIGAFAAAFAFLAMAYASLSPNVNDQIQPLIPALKSNWLIAHVVTCFLGYAAFTIAFSISLLFLFQLNGNGDSRWTTMLPNPTVLDELTHRMVVLGFLFLTAGIITGSVWANSAWGAYWSWDPKETWSLITWFIYASLLHARLVRGWSGKRIAWLSVVGFFAVIFTYFGVNLLPGLHSYAQ